MLDLNFRFYYRSFHFTLFYSDATQRLQQYFAETGIHIHQCVLPEKQAYWKQCHNFSSCTKSCGTGTRQCTNSCENGSVGDVGCPADKQENIQSCNVFDCIDASRWVEIFSQNSVGHNWAGHCTSASNCAHTFDAHNFIDFTRLGNTPEYYFKFVYTNVQGNGNIFKHELNWRQSVNPFTQTNANVYPTEVAFGPAGGLPTLFSGLSLSANQNLALFDGELNGPAGYRFYAVGSMTTSNGHFPAYYLNGRPYTAGGIQLYLGVFSTYI